jgi:hypothetical protein
MVTIDPQVLIDGTILTGSILGATAAGLVPFWQKIRENDALGGEPIHFDKKFAGTIIIALVIGIATAIMSFDTISAQVNVHDTIVKIFIVAVVASATSNITLNRFLAVGGLTTTVKELRTENIALKSTMGLIKQEVTPVDNTGVVRTTEEVKKL